MITPISRRQFLRGRLAAKHRAMRPPWAVEEPAFLERCSRCGDCITACEEGVIQSDSGYPQLVFTDSGCSFCGDCANACNTGALLNTNDSTEPGWNYSASLNDEHCLAHRGVVCQVCAEQCDAGAIRFQLAAGRVPTPELSSADCTACGYCIAACPGKALSIIPFNRSNQQEQEDTQCMSQA